jgi:hypothetical protein
MMKNLIPASTLAAFLLSACQFNQSVNKDLGTGAFSKGDGLGCDDISISINGKPDKRNTFVYGEKVLISFNDMTGFKTENSKVYPGLSLYVIKNEKDTVQFYPNLLGDLKDGTTLSPLKLEASFVAAVSYKNREKYKVHIRIWDTKGTGSFTYELPFNVEENKFLKINSNGVSYSNIYLWDETNKKPVFDKKIKQDDEFILILEGLDGLEQKNGKVYPTLSIDIVDNKGSKIISNPNILAKYEEEGIDAESFTKDQLPVTITFTKGNIDNPCILKTILVDKNSAKKLEISTELEIR